MTIPSGSSEKIESKKSLAAAMGFSPMDSEAPQEIKQPALFSGQPFGNKTLLAAFNMPEKHKEDTSGGNAPQQIAWVPYGASRISGSKIGFGPLSGFLLKKDEASLDL